MREHIKCLMCCNQNMFANEEVEGFGHRFDSRDTKALIAAPVVKVGGAITDPTFSEKYVSITPGDSRTLCFTLLSGIASQSKFIPLRYCPITFELEICSIIYDPIITPADPRWVQ